MSLGYQGPLFLLAFDHRESFQKKLFRIAGVPTDAETARIADGKQLIFEGFLRAAKNHAPAAGAGVLVDEQFGSAIARQAKQRGIILAMPVEKSGQNEFDFEYGDDFGIHIERFDPTFAKVLVRYNPAGDREMNQRQVRRLRRLTEWLHARDRKFLFELLVPAEPDQLARVGDSVARFDQELRPQLMAETIRELQGAGVEPDIWKIEGLDSSADCRTVAQVARSNGRDAVGCVVLGRGADAAAVERWLRAAAGVPGYIGFAIGRTIWWDTLTAYLRDPSDHNNRNKAADQIAGNYRHMIDIYTAV